MLEKSFSSRLMRERATSQAAPSGVPWPLGRPSAATRNFGLVVWFPAAPYKNGTKQISTSKDLRFGCFKESGLCFFFSNQTNFSRQRNCRGDYRQRLKLSSYLFSGTVSLGSERYEICRIRIKPCPLPGKRNYLPSAYWKDLFPLAIYNARVSNSQPELTRVVTEVSE